MDIHLTILTVLFFGRAVGVFLVAIALRPLLQKRLGDDITGIIMYAPAAFIATMAWDIMIEIFSDTLLNAKYFAVGLMTVTTKYIIEKASATMF